MKDVLKSGVEKLTQIEGIDQETAEKILPSNAAGFRTLENTSGQEQEYTDAPAPSADEPST